MSESKLPLEGIRVLDLTHARAGPTAVRQLADWGADAIKIEMPSNKEEGLGGARHGPDFLNLHRNKRALSLNLKTPEGLEIFMALAKDADVIVENFRAEVKHRLGIDYDSVRAINPRIIYGSISGFGQTGPISKRAGVDQIAQGMGGLMSITGLPGQGPVRVGIPIADLTAGMYLAQGILLALIERGQSGEGQWVHTSLLEAQISMLDFQAARWLIDEDVPGQAGNDHPTGIPMGAFKTADGAVNIAAAGGRLWTRFLEVADAQELADHPDYVSAKLRSQNRAALNEVIGGIMAKRTSQDWIESLSEAGVPCGPINSIDQTFAEPQVRHLSIAQPMHHPAKGVVNVVGQPVHLERTPQPPKIRKATPDVGGNTDEVLAELGYDQARIDDLRQRGVV
ncbi:MAG: CoA transferase [Alphaproteobacteria bacterium]|jgi:formyl-CoA transferase|nr:formyl-CoA transferase [Rhodospirillaceae bacterium]MDP6022953.1 CoA transferase [Alphaproteobacteria bacterium]MDP6253776.1 CoA transferase [Alphaproteobacteria bacterium]MDP7055772.1 CoA transferase [Alphaproteobacteria bacterium]MDP7230469.1 CoA transferase [Alphaproteobacteria bacterium]|tara:strand:- start:1058 stop:2245 length:1188 start_codon:yes stop_codon:yes gene_type:complete